MMAHIKKKYANITAEAVKIFISLCEECQCRRNKTTRANLVVKPIWSSDLNSRGQVNLIDMQSQPDGNFKWILNYQDHFTKFVHLRPLQRKCADEVASTLFDIFLTTNGAPHILQSDNGREFVNRTITELVKLWPGLKLVHGRPRHPQSQGSVEKSNDEVHRQLVSWMRDNDSTSWAQGLKFVQFQKNSSHHSRLGMTPCEAVFGQPTSIGLTSSSLPAEILSLISTEDDLEAIISGDFNTPATELPTSSTGNMSSIDVSAHERSTNEAASSEAATSTEVSIHEPPIQTNDTELEHDLVYSSLVAPICNSVHEPLVPTSDGASQEISVHELFITPSDDAAEGTATVDQNQAVCTICETSLCGSAVVCTSCYGVVHPDCTNDGQCQLCCRKLRRQVKRKATLEAQERQAKKMTKNSNSILQPLNIGDNVRVPIPRFDRGRSDPPNLLGVVTNISQGKYDIGTTVGHLERTFSRNQIEKCPSKIITENDVPEKTLSVRSAVAENSVANGQGFISCNCKKGCSARCKCKKNNLLCNSRCHSSLTCKNK